MLTLRAINGERRSAAIRQQTSDLVVIREAARNAIVTLRACRGSSCSWGSGQTIATLPGSAPSTQWKATGKGNVTFLAQVSTAGGVVTSNPVTVNVKKGKKKH